MHPAFYALNAYDVSTYTLGFNPKFETSFWGLVFRPYTRVIYRDGDDTDGHGTFVASIIAGSDLSAGDLILPPVRNVAVSNCTYTDVLVLKTNGFTIGNCLNDPTLICTNYDITPIPTTVTNCVTSCAQTNVAKEVANCANGQGLCVFRSEQSASLPFLEGKS